MLACPATADDYRSAGKHRKDLNLGTPLISLYSGAGGLDLGFVAAGFAPRFANDIDQQARENYSAVMAAAQVDLDPHQYHVGDVSDDYSRVGRREDSVLIGGPPCQGFSRAGRMDPNDPRSRHVGNFISAVQAVRPRAFVMENVRALATSARWRPILERAVSKAGALGYETRLIVLNSRDYGVAQSRERMFLIGVDKNEKADTECLVLPADAGGATVGVRDSLIHLQPYDMQEEWQKCVARIVPARVPVMRPSPFAGMFFNGQGRPLDLDAPAPTLSASLGGNHTPIVDQAWLEDSSEGGAQIRAYHRALSDGHRAFVPSTWRRLSLIEAAQLQTFPSDVAWLRRPSTSLRHIGNAVPPRLANEVASRVKKLLSI